MGYDSNVVQVRDVGEIDPALGITDTGDSLLTINGQAGYKLLSTPKFEIAASYGLYQTMHCRLSRFDLGGHTFDAIIYTTADMD